MKVAVDVAGFNYSEEEFDEAFIKFYELNPVQVFHIRSGQAVTVGPVTISKLPW